MRFGILRLRFEVGSLEVYGLKFKVWRLKCGDRGLRFHDWAEASQKAGK